MNLTLYTGPLCRFYAAETPESAPEILPAILGWRRLITPHFRSAGVPAVDWNESPEAPSSRTPLGHAPYWSLRLVAAYAECAPGAVPSAVPHDLGADPALQALRERFLRSQFPHLHACDLWLPVRCADPVVVQTPGEQSKPIGSAALLRAELEQCRARVLGAPTRADLERIAASDEGTPLFRDAARALCLWLPV
ncbi:MAG: hypothetical protein ACOYN0_19310, partial [Phycisphaerales bacterium]